MSDRIPYPDCLICGKALFCRTGRVHQSCVVIDCPHKLGGCKTCEDASIGIASLTTLKEDKPMSKSMEKRIRIQKGDTPCKTCGGSGEITNRQAHEDASGVGLDESFFLISAINPTEMVPCSDCSVCEKCGGTGIKGQRPDLAEQLVDGLNDAGLRVKREIQVIEKCDCHKGRE